MRNDLLFMIWFLWVITLCKEVVLSDGESSEQNNAAEGYSITDEMNMVANQCCSDNSPECCISLTYRKSISKRQDVPPEFGGAYYCEFFDVTKTSECGNLDYILLPISKSCDFTRVLWNLQWISSDKEALNFVKAQVLADKEIILNNADDFELPPDDEHNPTGYHALKFPIESDPWNKAKQTISICTQLEPGNIIDNIEGNDIEIGYSIDNNDIFKCSNKTIRDICSIDTSLATYNAMDIPLNVENLHGNEQVKINNANDPRFNNFFNTFEYYWNEYVGLGIAIFAASIFFNMVMCFYWSGYKASYIYAHTQQKITKIIIDSDEDNDDQTEEESDDTDDSNRDDYY
eukprot:185869_1